MKERIFVVLVGIVLSLVIVSSAFAEIIFTGKSDTIPRFIHVVGVGDFEVMDGRVNFEKELIRRSQLLGVKIEVPEVIEIFMPPTKNTVAGLLIGVTMSKIKEGLKIPAFYSREKGLLREFNGPRLVDGHGADVIDAKIYFHGSTRVAITRGGKINPAVQMEKGQQDIQMFIYKKGYKLKIINVVLSKEAMADEKLKVSVADSDIVLESLGAAPF